MNPSGYRIEEKKQESSYARPNTGRTTTTTTSPYPVVEDPSPSPAGSYKSTHSSRSSVLERAREYNRRIDHQKARTPVRDETLESPDPMDDNNDDGDRRSRSLERGRRRDPSPPSLHPRSPSQPPQPPPPQSQYGHTVRSKSVGRDGGSSLRDRASVTQHHHRSTPQQSQPSHTTPTTTNASVASSRPSSASSAVSPDAHGNQVQPQQVRHLRAVRHDHPPHDDTVPTPSQPRDHNNNNNLPTQQDDNNNNNNAVVTPELLVDALSGHEDGLLAIAETLMEHYDQGYDVMGEAIIDAFADVQKLFQHVVEAAHMEGAALEASRTRDEMAELRRAAARDDALTDTGGPATPNRHDEFIDVDVKELLSDAIREASQVPDDDEDHNDHSHTIRLNLYQTACNNASFLLPVDSDHRGRLQLSLARAESMPADRACAILRYSMDDVLRSGRRAQAQSRPDDTGRADVVLPGNHRIGSSASMTGSGGGSSHHHHHVMSSSTAVQSHDEALESLKLELRDILDAPVYRDTPLASVADRFWTALAERQAAHQKNAQALEQNLAKLKGEFLLARAEWEEKLNQSVATAESYKQKYHTAQDRPSHSEHSGRSVSSSLDGDRSPSRMQHGDHTSVYGSVRSAASKAETVATGVSGFAQQARTLMHTNFNCAAPTALDDEEEEEHHERGSRGRRGRSDPRDMDIRVVEPSRSRSRTKTTNASRSFREYSKSPHRVDV